ncbi:MAG: hypothetical protein V1852_32735 [Pseudomonadota bacterium]
MKNKKMNWNRIKLNMKNVYQLTITIGCLFCFSGCAFYEGITNYFNSTDHYLTFKQDQRVMYEPGAEEFTATVASELPLAIKKVESRQYSTFPDKVLIYVTKTPESFKKMTGRGVSAMMYRKSIFLSPKLLEKPDTIKLYIAHELSHLHLHQHLGDYAYLGIPSWFLEGLAAFVSDGGGAENVTDDEVMESIRSGNHFIPFEDAGLSDLFRPRYASYFKIRHKFKHHLFYRQCMLFVSFLENEHPVQFKTFVIDLEKGIDFSDAFHLSFGVDTMTKWNAFKSQIIKS